MNINGKNWRRGGILSGGELSDPSTYSKLFSSYTVLPPPSEYLERL